MEQLKAAAQIQIKEIEKQIETRFEEIRQQVSNCKVNLMFNSVYKWVNPDKKSNKDRQINKN